MNAPTLPVDQSEKFMRRREAAAYLHERFGVGTPNTLAKGASKGSGPTFHRFGGVILYRQCDLDAWAQAKLSRPLTSTADNTAKK